MTALSSAFNKQGLAFLSAGNHARALDFFRAAIADDPLMADAYTNLGVTLFMGNWTRRYASTAHPPNPGDRDGGLSDAIAAFQQSLSLRPEHPETLLNLGYALWRSDDLDGALRVLSQAVDLDGSPTAQIALGSVYWELGDTDAARQHCEQGLVGDPTSLLGHDTLREVCQYHGDEATALEQCDKLIRLFPDHPVHTYKRSLVMLTYDDPAGWAAMESRYEGSSDGLSQIAQENPFWFSRLFGRRWDGCQTGHLLVQTEQGFGDVIQFLRYIPLAAQRCSKLSLNIPESLRKLARQAFQGTNVEVCDAIPEDFDHYCLIMSLAHLLEATESFPSPPYLVASPHKYAEVRKLEGMKIGVAWAGKRTKPDDRYRSIPFEKISRLLELPAHFVSLQFPSDIDLRPYRIVEMHPTPTSFAGKLLIDWTETAALIDALDLVISVDTAVLHLAGALAKPVWMLNRYSTDWRWGLHGSDSKWYPSLRIFRQPKLGDWDSVIDQVYAALSGEVGSAKSTGSLVL